jgi:hypothetical protein
LQNENNCKAIYVDIFMEKAARKVIHPWCMKLNMPELDKLKEVKIFIGRAVVKRTNISYKKK